MKVIRFIFPLKIIKWRLTQIMFPREMFSFLALFLLIFVASIITSRFLTLSFISASIAALAAEYADSRASVMVA